MAIKSGKTCYMCEKLASSREHAPPICIFPEQKDIPHGLDYRKNLITVDSCDEHNIKKSTDDEYLLYILSSTVTSSDVGLNQFFTKVHRAILRKPALAAELTKKSYPAILQNKENGKSIEVVGLDIDIKRIKDIFGKIARAIYFNHTNQKHLGSIEVYINLFPNLQNQNETAEIEKLFLICSEKLDGHKSYGDNPEVFIYKIIAFENSSIIELQFYTFNKAIVFLNKT
jgi:hypothetical protein